MKQVVLLTALLPLLLFLVLRLLRRGQLGDAVWLPCAEILLEILRLGGGLRYEADCEDLATRMATVIRTIRFALLILTVPNATFVI